MDIRVLRYFLAVAQEESISAAAQALHLSQPTLSRQLMDLEEELGKPLLIRGPRRITLTEDGLLLRKRAAEIVDLVEKTQAEVMDHTDTVAGDIYIGAGETDAFRLLVRTGITLRRQYPGIRFHVFSGAADEVLERLEKGLIDFGVLVGNAPDKYESIVLPVKDQSGILMPKDHPLTAKESIRPQDLWDQPLIVSRRAGASAPFYQWLGRGPNQLNLVATHTLIYNASLMVQEGLGLALSLDKLINTSGDSNLCFRPLEPPLEVELHVVWKKYQVFSKAAERYLEQLQQDFNSQ